MNNEYEPDWESWEDAYQSADSLPEEQDPSPVNKSSKELVQPEATNDQDSKYAHLQVIKPKKKATLKEREIGGLWPRKNPKDGSEMFTGQIKINGENHDVVYFYNEYYVKGGRNPKFRIYWNS